MQIENRHVSDLIPYARNARTHSDEQVAQVAASIREFGWTNPVLVDGENGIIAGHGRVLAAQKLGMDEIPTIELSYLSEAQKRAYILADNKLAMNADWDSDLLRIEIDDLKELEFDIDIIGFDPDEFKDILSTDFPSLADGDKEPFQQMTFTLHDEQVEQVLLALTGSKGMGDFDSENENSNGNAIARICETFNGLG